MTTERPRSVLALWPIVLAWAIALAAGYATYRLSVHSIENGFARWLLDVVTFAASIAVGNTLQRRLLARIDPDGSLRHRAMSFNADAED